MDMVTLPCKFWQEANRRSVLRQGLWSLLRLSQYNIRIPVPPGQRRPWDPHSLHRRRPGGPPRLRPWRLRTWDCLRRRPAGPPRRLQGVLANPWSQPKHREHVLRRRHARRVRRCNRRRRPHPQHLDRGGRHAAKVLEGWDRPRGAACGQARHRGVLQRREFRAGASHGVQPCTMDDNSRCEQHRPGFWFYHLARQRQYDKGTTTTALGKA